MQKSILLYIFITLSFSCFSQKTQTQHMRDAEKVATEWLKGINNKKYVDCWNMLSETAQNKSDSVKWIEYMSLELMPELGMCISRKFYISELEKNLEGFPKGSYVTIQYKSKYSNTNFIEEKLVLFLDSDLIWKIMSYLVDYQLKNDNGEISKSKL